MIKKILLVLLLFCIIFVNADVLDIGNVDREITLSTDRDQALEDLNLSSYGHEFVKLDNTTFRYCLKKPGAINKCKVFKNYEIRTPLAGDPIRIEYDDTQMREMGNEWEETVIKTIADTKINRTIRQEQVLERGTTTTRSR